MARIVLVSDLHMGVGGPQDQFRADEALATLLRGLAADHGVTELVLLGDAFDLAVPQTQGDGERGPGRRLQAVLDAHPQVRRALQVLLRRGVRLTVVIGNHDVQLADVRVQSALVDALAVESRAVSFHPWLYHVPGLLLAEHGHQHHDVNAFMTGARPLREDGSVAHEPFGYQLATLRQRYGTRTALLRATGAAVREAVRLSVPAGMSPRAAYRRDVLPGYADEVALAYDCVLRLDEAGRRSPPAIVARLVRQWIRAGDRSYLPLAAQAVRVGLGGAAPPFLVMGHSHAADARRLATAQGREVFYLNSGTWSVRGPKQEDTTLPATSMTWVEVDGPEGRSSARARVLWLSDEGVPAVLAEADGTGVLSRAAVPEGRGRTTTSADGCVRRRARVDWSSRDGSQMT